MRFEEYHAECMRDPEYRFWYYFYAVLHFPRRVLARFLFWLRDTSEHAAFGLLGISFGYGIDDELQAVGPQDETLTIDD